MLTWSFLFGSSSCMVRRRHCFTAKRRYFGSKTSKMTRNGKCLSFWSSSSASASGKVPQTGSKTQRNILLLHNCCDPIFFQILPLSNPLSLQLLHCRSDDGQVVAGLDGERLLFFGRRRSRFRTPVPRRRQLARLVIEIQTYRRDLVVRKLVVRLGHRKLLVFFLLLCFFSL